MNSPGNAFVDTTPRHISMNSSIICFAISIEEIGIYSICTENQTKFQYKEP